MPVARKKREVNVFPRIFNWLKELDDYDNSDPDEMVIAIVSDDPLLMKAAGRVWVAFAARVPLRAQLAVAAAHTFVHIQEVLGGIVRVTDLDVGPLNDRMLLTPLVEAILLALGVDAVALNSAGEELSKWVDLSEDLLLAGNDVPCKLLPAMLGMIILLRIAEGWQNANNNQPMTLRQLLASLETSDPLPPDITPET